MGYKTRKASAVKWEDVPEKNKKLMIAVCTIIQSFLADERDWRDRYLAKYYKIVRADEARKK